MHLERPCFSIVFLIAVVVGSFSGPDTVKAQAPSLIQFSVDGQQYEGMKLVSLAHEMLLIGRDGGLHSVDPTDQQSQIRELGSPYQPVSVTELKNQLQSEFGAYFEVITTQNFLVVQPRGRGNQWPELFEKSHRGFISYMTRRGVNIRQGRFPMVAVVFPNEVAMYNEFRKRKIDMPRVAGIYSILSNRVITHDGGHSSMIAETVRHEAAHQSAFNSGVHSRVNDTPRWITEGIGQMFEPEGMLTSQSASQRRERANLESMMVIKKWVGPKENSEFALAMRSLVGGEEWFDDPGKVDYAYAASWAAMFYLAERQPKEFTAILNHTASRPPLVVYKREERVADFEEIVGMNIQDFSNRVMWFLRKL